MDKLKGSLQKFMRTKVGGVPAPLVAGVVGIGAILIIRKRRAAAGQGGAADSGSSTAQDASAGTGDAGISGAASSGGGYDAGGGYVGGGGEGYMPSSIMGPSDGSGIIAASPAGPTTELVRKNIRNVRNVQKWTYIGKVRKTKIVHPRQGPRHVGGGNQHPIMAKKYGFRPNMQAGNRGRRHVRQTPPIVKLGRKPRSGSR